jgi:hypothetical protein
VQIFARFMSNGTDSDDDVADGITEDDASKVGTKEGNSQPMQFMQSIHNEAARVLQQQSNGSGRSTRQTRIIIGSARSTCQT